MILAEQWRAALADVVIRHPNRESRVFVTISDEAMLMLSLDATRDSRDPNHVMTPFVISNVQLTYFPGERLARQWLAAAWAGYIQHEALELVTIGGTTKRPLDPHQPPFVFDRGLRDGLPVELTPETLISSLAAVMPRETAEALCAV